MNGCLSDRALWEASEGEGAGADREHLGSCEPCRRRARRLARDLKVIGQVLRDVPPPAEAAATRRRSAGVRWVAAAAVVVLGLGLAWVRGGPARDRLTLARTEDMPVLQALSTAVLADSGVEWALAPAPPTDMDVIAAAVDEAVPCEWQPEGCEDEAQFPF